MASKWAKVIDKLPKHIGTEPAHQMKVDAVKQAMIADPEFRRTATSLAWTYANLRINRESKPIDELLREDPSWGKKTLKELMSEFQVQLDAVAQMMEEQFEVEGTTSMNLDIGYNVRVQREPYAQVVDKEAFRVWCLENGFEREMHLMWAKTNSICKERLEQGDKDPDGVEVKAITKVFLTRR